ncbi:hypothetical protein V6N13_046677 [Hibiscus sabdariffa]|uniref:t-SNARE coiled-coil homology domain-containing protein n=1 Tax=Hibiscus sabdariffa TaxID=183260 RepID=A0ABR2P007_9ROSI
MNNANEPPIKPRRSKSREVASRFLSSPSSTPTHDSGHHSPNKALSPLRRKSTSVDTRKHHRSLDDPSGGLLGGLWPSSTTTTTSSSPSSNSKKLDTLADYLGNERLKDFIERKSYEKRANAQPFSLTKQTSHTEFNRLIENDKEVSAKENHRPSMGGSMRYTAKLCFSRKSSSSSPSPNIVPGRFSVDENALYKKSSSSSSQRKPDFLLTDNCVAVDSEGGISDQCSASKNDSPAISITNSSPNSSKSGIEVSSKYLKEVATRNRPRGITWDSSNLHPVSADSSPKMKKMLALKNVIRRTNSHGASASQWALSPGRSGSPTMSVENKVKPMSFSSLKPPTSPSRTKGVEKFLNLGLMDLFKSKKSTALQPGSHDAESVHQLRLIHNSLIQWQYANAKADAANRSINNQVQNYLLYGWNSLMKLQHSVVQKKLKLQKEKLEIKLDFILQSQMKALESWADMERQHLSAISMTKECLHAVVCKLPLVEGAEVDPQSTLVALRHAFDLTASIKSKLPASSPGIEKTVSLVSELAEVVAQEKLLLEECIELFRMISILEEQQIQGGKVIDPIKSEEMNDLISTSFKRYSDLKQQVHLDDLEARNETVNLDEFFEDVDNVKDDMRVVEQVYKRLQQSNEDTKAAHSAKAVKDLRARMDSDVEQVLKRVKVIKGKLEALEKSNAAHQKLPGCGPGSSAYRTRTSVVSGLGNKLKAMMDGFQGLRAKMTAEYKETVERRYFTVTGQKADEEMIEKLIESGESETLLQQAIQEQGRGQILDTISEIQERHDAMQEIEKGLIELHQLFLDMAILVETQGHQLNDIESHIARASSFVMRGAEQLEVANEYQKSSRKWGCIAIVGVVLIVIILLPIFIKHN